MRKPSPVLCAVTILLIGSLACGLPNVAPGTSISTLDANAVETIIMQTMSVALTQTATAAPVWVTSSPTLTPGPTLSPTATPSPAPIYTETPLTPLVSVSVNTNCRSGPGQAYDQIGALMVGETAEVSGRNPTNRYWYVRNPDQENEYCWVWGEYATLAGNAAAIPVYTPPATPTPVPNFVADFAGLERCSGWWVNFQLTNTSGLAFRSVSIVVKDISAETNISLYADHFTAIDDCLDSTTQDALGAGQTVTVSVPAFARSPEGHMLRATITLCSAPRQQGACVTQVIKFSP